MTEATETIEAEVVEVDEQGDPVDSPGQAVAVREEAAVITRGEITVDDLLEQSQKITVAMQQAMTKDVHYGIIPGVKKPSLLKPGAEKLLVLFRLSPSYVTEKVWGPDDHLTCITTCTLKHAPTEMIVATGEGLCSTRESRYAFRRGERLCPACGEPQVRKGKPRGSQPGNWYCWKKEGGCGETWPLDSEQGAAFEAMDTGKVANPDLPDSWNTVLKMADKRALVAAILNGTAASDVFTQDVEDGPRGGGASGAPEPGEKPEPIDFDALIAKTDPGKELLPGAMWNEGPAGIAKALTVINGSVDWPRVIGELLAAEYGVETTNGLTGEKRKEFWLRMSNAVWRINHEANPNAMPPAEDTLIRDMIAWAYGGYVATLHPIGAAEHADLDAQAEAAATEDVPWTAEVREALAKTQEDEDGAASD